MKHKSPDLWREGEPCQFSVVEDNLFYECMFWLIFWIIFLGGTCGLWYLIFRAMGMMK